MAGLYIKELLLRGDLKRCLIVAPGGLQDELSDRFGLRFDILTRDMIEATADPLVEHDLLIARLDHLSRTDELVERLRATEWDLVVVDEAHPMSAHRFGGEVRETRRYRFGKVLAQASRHFLLMTATPHDGKDEDFQLFLALLDPDRFEGRPTDATVAPSGPRRCTTPSPTSSGLSGRPASSRRLPPSGGSRRRRQHFVSVDRLGRSESGVER